MIYLPILTYHRLLAEAPSKTVDPKRIAVSQDQFRSHLKWLKRLGYRTVSLAGYVRDLRAGKKPAARTFAITFDDGYTEVLTLGLPILKEFDYTATIFAVPSQTANQWDDGAASLLSADQLRQWRDSGMEIGAHTCRHVHLPQVSPNIARQEIHDAKTQLEKILGQAVTTFAYPYGENNPMTQDMVRDAGYDAGFATDRASCNHTDNLFQIRRVVIFPRNNVWEILWKVQRWYPAYQDRKRGS